MVGMRRKAIEGIHAQMMALSQGHQMDIDLESWSDTEYTAAQRPKTERHGHGDTHAGRKGAGPRAEALSRRTAKWT